MSEIQEVDVFVKPDGTVKVEVHGIRGPQCLALTKKIEQLLGGHIIERTHTDEFNQAQQEESQDNRDEQRT